MGYTNTPCSERLVEILRSAPRLDAKAHTPPRGNNNNHTKVLAPGSHSHHATREQTASRSKKSEPRGPQRRRLGMYVASEQQRPLVQDEKEGPKRYQLSGSSGLPVGQCFRPCYIAALSFFSRAMVWLPLLPTPNRHALVVPSICGGFRPAGGL